MPTRYSSDHSLRDAEAVARNLGIGYHVVAIDDIEQSIECVKMIRANFADATIVARARNVQHYY